MSGFVYFVQGTHGGPVKVGWATDPTRRLAELQVGNPTELVIVHVVAGPVAQEVRLHEALADWSVRGEWFNPNAAFRSAVRIALGDPKALSALRLSEDQGLHLCAGCLAMAREVWEFDAAHLALEAGELLSAIRLGVAREARPRGRKLTPEGWWPKPGDRVSIADSDGRKRVWVAAVVLAEPRGATGAEWVRVRTARLHLAGDWIEERHSVRIQNLRPRLAHVAPVDEPILLRPQNEATR